MDNLVDKLNDGISEITTANFNLHKESGDLQEWLNEWRVKMACISMEVFTIIKSCVDDGR